MGASRKKEPDLLAVIESHWPDALSGQCALELGLSGGLDSVALLHLLCRLRERHPFGLSAVHVHHGLSRDADAWADFCVELCARHRVPLRVERVTVKRAGGQSLEAEARAVRYAAFAASPSNALVLAQHQDDQVETVLLQTLRGGGPHALAAMPAWGDGPGLPIWRPLLSVTRERLQAYAQEYGLAWVEDDSNLDTRYRRNWLRQQWLPALAAYLPDYRQGVARCAGNMADAASVLDEVAAQDLEQAVTQGRVQLDRLAALSLPRQRLLLLRWVERAGLGMPTPASLEEFQQQLWQAAADRQPEWVLPSGVVFRYRGELWAEPLYPVPPALVFAFDPAQVLRLPDWGGELRWRPDPKGLDAGWLGKSLELRPRHGGEGLRQSIGTKPVKNLMQEAGLPPRWRARWPLVFDGDRLLALAGLAVAVDAQPGAGQGWWPEWSPQSEERQ
jgi:tRNA(Ile)-lysidine synthase